MVAFTQHRRRPRRKTRQPRGAWISKPRPAKPKPTPMTEQLFTNWHHLQPDELSDRILQIQRLAAVIHFDEAAWRTLDHMRQALKAATGSH